MAEIAELEGWVREELSLPPGAVVTIAEQPGTDPRCSDVVTSIQVDDGSEQYSFHVEQPLADLARMDLVAALAFGGAH